MICGENRQFDPHTFLTGAGPGRRVVQYRKKQLIFAQGESATALFYVQRGQVKLTVLSVQGKEATITLLGAGDFLGESCIGRDRPVHTASAHAITDGCALKIERDTLLEVLHSQRAFSDFLIAYLVSRNNRVQDDLVNQLFNSAEKRLARILLSMARFGKEEKSDLILPRISQETLAEMVGTSRSRVSVFMNRFKKQGLVEYDRELELKVHSSRLSELLQDEGG